MLELRVISKAVAQKIYDELYCMGRPSENRVLICSGEEKVTKSGIIVPEVVEEGISKKGVIVQVGRITEEYSSYKELLQSGVIVFYGDYAGKELNLDIDSLPKNHKLRVLSINEIVYLMSNNQ